MGAPGGGDAAAAQRLAALLKALGAAVTPDGGDAFPSATADPNPDNGLDGDSRSNAALTQLLQDALQRSPGEAAFAQSPDRNGSRVGADAAASRRASELLLRPGGPSRARAPPGSDALTQKVLGLLEGMGQPNEDTNTAKKTSLEYRGQWQPKPNGAETGHGVVPTDWAIELASENDRQLASFGWAGGAQLCLSNAFREADKMEAQAQDLIDSGVCTEDDAPVLCIRRIAAATEEREALMRRQWCDIDFQEGEEANSELVKHLERDFAGQLASAASKQFRHEGPHREREDVDESSPGKETSPWYNIKLSGGLPPGKVYLSTPFSGDSVDLYGHDDQSGRQRWLIEPGKSSSCGEAAACDDQDNGSRWYNLRLAGGTSRGRRLLSRGARGRLELAELDDGSGRQRWHLTRCVGARCMLNIRPAPGDPGTGAAAEVEAAASGKFLGADASGSVGLYAEDDGSGRQRWLVPEWPELEAKAGSAPVKPRRSEVMRTGDHVVALAVSSGAKEAISLKDLSQEQMTRVLGQNRNLGTAIDLVGVYLKNYEIDKADRLCARIEPLCRERGGVWLFKLLNFFSTVRMKQSRYEEALAMYEEYETLIGYAPQEAWELYDTVYRNYGWIYTSLHDYGKALDYFQKAVEVKRAHGIRAHWFDQWDLGKTHARLSLQQGRFENLELALKLIKEGLEMHRHAEPKDVIMRCKMLNSAGECACVRGDFCEDRSASERWYDEGIRLHQESYELYMGVLGPTKPLTGWAMEDLAGAYQRRGKLEEAKALLHGALKVECSKDIIKLSSMARLLDSVLDAHKGTGDREGLAQCQEAINTGLVNLQRRRINQTEAASYAALLQKIAQVLLIHDLDNRPGAADLLEEGLAHLERSVAQLSESEPAAGGASGERRDDDSTQQRFWVAPRAGQQSLEVDAAKLTVEMRRLLHRCRDEEDLVEDVRCWPDAAAGSLANIVGIAANQHGDMDPDAPFIPPSMAGTISGEDPGATSPTKRPAPSERTLDLAAAGWQLPERFEVIDDFPAVD